MIEESIEPDPPAGAEENNPRAADENNPPGGAEGELIAAEVMPSEELGRQADPGPPVDETGLAAERDRLARLLRETRLQLSMAQARLTALEQSATLQLGRTIVRAARRPWSRGAQLPRDLYRMWRTGGASQASPANSPAVLALASAQLSDLSGGGERLLSALTAPGLSARTGLLEPAVPPGLVVTGVLTARACVTLAADAAVHPLLPHDADIGLESSGADLVIIEAAALLAGSAWAYAVDPAGTDRGRRLARLIAAARSLGKPVIFVRDIPAHLAPGLEWVAATCDAVSDDGLGVPLARFNPIGLPVMRDTRPVYVGSRDPREAPAVRALLDILTRDTAKGAPGGALPDGEPVGEPVQVSGEIRWQALPDYYRAHALFVTASPAQAREQRACGARVIMAEGDGEAVLRRLTEAAAAGPPGWPEIRDELRHIFLGHATAARLGALAGLAGLPGDLITGRQIAALATAADADAAAALGATVLRQRLLPAELVVSAGPGEDAREAVTAALAEVAARGVRVQVFAHAEPSWLRACAQRAGSPWAAPLDGDGDHDASYLLDLACARESSQADAVGYTGASYAYTTYLDSPGLARRELLGTGALDVSHGLRLFSVS